MFNPVVLQTVLVVSNGRQRNPCTIGRNDLHLVQGLRILGVFGVDLHHHLILVQAVVDGRNLPLAVGVVQHRSNHVHIDPEAFGLIAIYHQGDLLRTPPFTGINGSEFGQGLECSHHFGVPGA